KAIEPAPVFKALCKTPRSVVASKPSLPVSADPQIYISEDAIMKFYRGLRYLSALVLLTTFAGSQLVFAQSQSTVAPTKIIFHKNKYSPMDDVKIGREAAGQAERQLQVVRDPQLSEYLESLGQRLVRSIPGEFQHPEFRYYFRVVADRSINAFALPGGPMYVNTGAI